MELMLFRKKTQGKIILNGKVVLAAWTAETGHVIAIQHSNGD